jgi:hypothetical protein
MTNIKQALKTFNILTNIKLISLNMKQALQKRSWKIAKCYYLTIFIVFK